MFRISGHFKFKGFPGGAAEREIPFMPFLFAFDKPDFVPEETHAGNAVDVLFAAASSQGTPMIGRHIKVERVVAVPKKMTIQESLKAMEEARADFKAFVLERSELFLTPKAYNEMDDDEKFVSALGSLTGAAVRWDIGLAREAAARIVEDVNDHKTAQMIRES